MAKTRKDGTIGGGYYFTPAAQTTQVDWSKVATQVSDTLHNEFEARKERREGIEQGAIDFTDSLQESMQSENEDVATMALNFADDASETMSIAKNNVLNGSITQREFNIIKNNLMRGAQTMGNLVKGYNEQFAEWEARVKDGKSMSIESEFLPEQLYGFHNFGDREGASKPYVNPMTGKVSVGKMVMNNTTGVLEMSKNQTDYSTVSSLESRNKSKYDKFDSIAAAQKVTKSLGKQVEAIMMGGVKERSDIYEDPRFKAAIDQFVQADSQNPVNVASVLYDDIGVIALDANGRRVPPGTQGAIMTSYKYTQDLAEANSSDHFILLTNGNYPVPDYDNDNWTGGKEAQKEEFHGFMDNVYKSQLDKTEVGYEMRAKSAGEINVGLDRQQARSAADQIAKIYSGSAAEIKSALGNLTALMGNKIKFQTAEREADGNLRLKMLVTKLDNNNKEYTVEETKTLPMKGLTQSEFIQSAITTFSPKTQGVDYTKYTSPMTKNQVSWGEAAQNITRKWGAIGEDIDGMFFKSTDDVFLDDKSTDVASLVKNLNNIIWDDEMVGATTANEVDIYSDNAGNLIEEIPMSGYNVKVQMQYPTEEKQWDALQYINKTLYDLKKADINLSQADLEKRLKKRGYDTFVTFY